MDKKGRGKTKFLWFELSKSGAKTVYYLGIGLLACVGISFIWLLYNFFVIQSVMTTWGVSSWYAGSPITYLVSYLVIQISLMIFAIYMISVGKKGK